jgi:hypothetical protein
MFVSRLQKEFYLSYEGENTFTFNKYLCHLAICTFKNEERPVQKMQVHESKNASPTMISPCRGRHPPKPSVINRKCSKKNLPKIHRPQNKQANDGGLVEKC